MVVQLMIEYGIALMMHNVIGALVDVLTQKYGLCFGWPKAFFFHFLIVPPEFFAILKNVLQLCFVHFCQQLQLSSNLWIRRLLLPNREPPL